MHRSTCLALSGLALAAAACGSSGAGTGAHPSDASAEGSLDATAEAAPSDASPGPEAAAEAAADAGRDAAPADAALDAHADRPAVPCGDAVADVYVTPPGLPAMTMADRGTLVRCATDSVLSPSDIAAAFAAKSVAGVTPTTGTSLYRIAYRTYRDDGVPGVSTARVYLPQVPRALPLPVVAVAHPTEGLAPGCVPSADPTSLEDEALPWASQGFAVIASDYAGLGNEGVQGYLDNHDQAHSMLDSVRALRAMLDPGALDDRVLLVGYSQGGGAVLAAQGLAGSYGPGPLSGVVVFAAEYYSRYNSVQFVTTLASPNELTIAAGVTVPVVTATRDYAFAYNVLGPDAGGSTFPDASAAGIAGALMSLCEVPFGGYLQGADVHVRDFLDDAFRASLLACIQRQPGCSGIGKQYYQWMARDLVAPDPAGAPVLYVQGLADTIMPPAQEAACNIGLLQEAGVPVQVCTDPPAQHTDVVARNVALGLAWSLRVLYGGSPPACSAAGMPACQP